MEFTSSTSSSEEIKIDVCDPCLKEGKYVAYTIRGADKEGSFEA